MSRDKDYQTLLNSKRWKQLRQWKLYRNQNCEVCQRKGKVSASVDIHHIVPVETAYTLEGMKALCFNPNNLMAVCIPCHIAIHAQLMSHTVKAHKQREAQRFERWKDKHKPPHQRKDHDKA